ncbi:MAG: mechanosensitive ion channel family protein [Acidiferrobacterales bacterium]
MLNSLATSLRRSASIFLLVFTLIPVSSAAVYAQGTTESIGGGGAATAFAAQQSPSGGRKIEPVRTGSPREIIETFLRLRKELENVVIAYRESKTREERDHLLQLISQFLELIDLSSVPKASRRQIGIETTAFLLDIFGRIALPPLESAPDEDAFNEDAPVAAWRVPHTPIRIVRKDEGPREGEFMFSERTVRVAPRFYHRIEDLPLRSSLGIETWSRTIPHITGVMIPADLVAAIPESLKETWLGTPIWKILFVAILSVLATFLLWQWHRMINRVEPRNKVTFLFRRLLTPMAIIVVVSILDSFIYFEVNVSGDVATTVAVAVNVVIYLAAVWTFWLVVLNIFEWIIPSPNISEENLDANLLRLAARFIGIVGGVVILAQGAQELGVPLYSVVAGLGIGGLAVALAIRPTLENLIGGVILYIDKPVRVGDFCSFGDQMGTVENIGVRTTKIRGLDRTLISVPNATLADMRLVNWAKCDRMLINTMIGLRYETEPDQLRYVLVKMREMLHAHPRIDRDTIRVRFAGHGASSLDIDIRVYALTREWNDFYAIREDIFLRINDIVSAAGTGFAFPSHTLYLGRDNGLDAERSEAAVKEVRSWRRSGELPFPRFSAEKVDRLEGTLDYPPRGSVEDRSSAPERREVLESLSADSDLEEPDSTEKRS